MEILALDVGAKRVGIARASIEACLAQPLKTVKTDEAIEQLHKIIKENEVKMIVAGLPRNLAGEDTQQTGWVRDWVAQAKAQLGVAFYWQDEALTSLEAMKHETRHSTLRDEPSGSDSKRNVKHDVDAQAATIILEDFLKTNKNNRVLV